MNISTDDNSIGMQSQPDPATLEREIDRQRDHISGIVDALSNKLGGSLPSGDMMNQLSGIVRANPLPALVTLAGLAWMYSSHNKKSVESRRHVHVNGEGMGSSSFSSGTYAGSGTSGMGSSSMGANSMGTSGMGTSSTGTSGIGTSSMGSSTTGTSSMGVSGSTTSSMGVSGVGTDGANSGRLQNLKQGASEKWVNAKEATRQRAQRANQGYQNMLETNPLAAGAIGIAVGALLGALLPATRKEDEMIGPVSARLKDGAKELARTGYQQAAEASRELTSSRGGNGGSLGSPSPTATMGPAPTQGQPS